MIARGSDGDCNGRVAFNNQQEVGNLNSHCSDHHGERHYSRATLARQKGIRVKPAGLGPAHHHASDGL